MESIADKVHILQVQVFFKQNRNILKKLIVQIFKKWMKKYILFSDVYNF